MGTGRTLIGSDRTPIGTDRTPIGTRRMQFGVGGISSVIILVSTGTGNITIKARRIPGEAEGLPIKTHLVSIKKIILHSV